MSVERYRPDVVVNGAVSVIDVAACDFAVFFYAAVAQERPPATHLLGALHVDIYYGCCLAVVRSTVEKLSLRAGYET